MMLNVCENGLDLDTNTWEIIVTLTSGNSSRSHAADPSLLTWNTEKMQVYKTSSNKQTKKKQKQKKKYIWRKGNVLK